MLRWLSRFFESKPTTAQDGATTAATEAVTGDTVRRSDGAVECSACGTRVKKLEGGLFGNVGPLEQWMANVCVPCGRVYCQNCLQLGGPTPCPRCGAPTKPAQRQYLQQIRKHDKTTGYRDTPDGAAPATGVQQVVAGPDATAERIEDARSKLVDLCAGFAGELIPLLKAAAAADRDAADAFVQIHLPVMLIVAGGASESSADEANLRTLISAIEALDVRLLRPNPPRDAVLNLVQGARALTGPLVITPYLKRRAIDMIERFPSP